MNYPTQRKNANLNIIRNLKKNFLNNVVGYSDHTLPDKTMSVLKLAFLYGAKIIEKHFTLDKTLPGNDHYHAMDENDLKTFISSQIFSFKNVLIVCAPPSTIILEISFDLRNTHICLAIFLL